MDYKRIIWLLKAEIIALAFILCLYGSSESFWPDQIFNKITTVLRVSWIQWTVSFLALGSSVGFAWLKGAQSREYSDGGSKSNWLSAAILMGGGAYFLQFSTASKTAQAMTWFCGIALGQSAATLLRLPEKRGIGLLRCAVIVLVLLLSASSLASTGGMLFYYHGHSRWSGLWDTPNIFGLLMGAGLALALGWFTEIPSSKGEVANRDKNKQSHGAIKCVLGILCLAVIALLGRGLLHSFSRGAWVGTAAGFVYLALAAWKQKSRPPDTDFRNSVSDDGSLAENLCVAEIQAKRSGAMWFRHNRVSLLVIMLSGFFLCFWHFRSADWQFARRAFSIFNTFDFSWQNRVAAWEGALCITAEHPWLGAGWNRAEGLYENYYLVPKVFSGQAIQMNDYLMLGATLGVPVLFSFGMYLWLCLVPNAKGGAWNVIQKTECEIEEYRTQNGEPEIIAESREQKAENQVDSLRATCRAGAIVLLVGFWFDGGLFTLATASTFWILLEFGSVLPRIHTNTHQ